MDFFGILASPAGHSLSPLLHNSVFAAEKILAAYHRHDITPEKLSDFMMEWKKNDSQKGLSVSIPHKETIISYVDTLTDAAQSIGAVNTVYKHDGKMIGDNTDWVGFSKSLKEQYDVSEKSVLVLGAGGATKAIVYALEQSNAKHIYIWNRTDEKASQLAFEFGGSCTSISDPSAVKNDVSLVINTTSLGMSGKNEKFSPLPESFWNDSHAGYDIVYTPKKTVFLCDCEKKGGKSISGEDMLLYQAVEQSMVFVPLDAKREEREKIMKNALVHHNSSSLWSAPQLTTHEKKNILQTIVHNTQKNIYNSYEYWEKTGIQKASHEFYSVLSTPKKTPHLIAEIKPASPSRGTIFTQDDTVESIADVYTKNGASVLSVLTDEIFFGASITNLAKAQNGTSLPLLRKDFIVHASQIFEARYFGAHAVLLMRSVLNATEIENFLCIANDLGMDCLVEVHDEHELRDVLENTSANIIGMNNRNLKTLQIDTNTFGNLLQIAKQYDRYSDIVWVCESGLSSFDDIEKYAQNAAAVLIGTGILLSGNREEKVQELSGGFCTT